MTTRKNLLDRVEIASPCSANWDEMTGTNRVRYCSECSKYVYNLSEMTRNEAEALLGSRGNELCARLIRDLDGTTLNVDSLPPVRLLGWKPGPVASAVVSALIGIAPAVPAVAQGQSSSHSSQSVDASGRRTHRPAPGTKSSTISGLVTDENGTAFPGAVVTLTSEASAEVLAQLTSDLGEFRFEALPSRTYIVEIQAKGYKLVKHHGVDLKQGEGRRLDVPLEKVLQVMGAMGIPMQPLRTLYLESDRIVLAQVSTIVDAELIGSTTLVRTSLSVSQTIKGDGHKPVIDVYTRRYGQEAGPLTEGETVLAFLQRKEDAHGGANSYELIYGGTSVKRLLPADMELYLQRLEELRVMLAKPVPTPSDTVEWLVRCAENPVTRREGALELNSSAWWEQYEKEESARRARAGETAVLTSRNPRDQEALFASLLTVEQKQRLVTALVKSEELAEGDLELLELVGRWNNPRLLPFLISYLHRFEGVAPESLSRVMQTVADVLHDKKVSTLLRHYRNDEPYTEVESEQTKVAAADTDDDADADEDTGADESDTTSASADRAPEPELTPEAATRVRVELLKKFLEAVEAKMTLASAKQ